MGREASVTQQQVNETAEALAGAGVRPSVRAIREKIGRGSMATLHKFLQHWEVNSSFQPRQMNSEIDVEIVKGINNMLSRHVQLAAKDGDERIANLQADMAMVVSENDRQAQELEERYIDLDTLRVQSLAQAVQIEELKSALSREREMLLLESQQREAAQIELAKALLRVEALPELHEELKQARADVRKIAEEAAELRGRLIELTSPTGNI